MVSFLLPTPLFLSPYTERCTNRIHAFDRLPKINCVLGLGYGRFFPLVCLGYNTADNDIGYDNNKYLLSTYDGLCTIQNALYTSPHLLV